MRAMLMTALLFAASSIVFAESPGESTPRFWADGNAEASARIEAVLNGPLSGVGLDFTETPLEEIVAFLRDEYNIEIVLDNASLQDIAVQPDVPVTVNFRKVSLRTALKQMLAPHDLHYVIDDEVLLITSLEVIRGGERTAVYPVADLMESAGMQELIEAVTSCNAASFVEEGGSGRVVPLADKHLVVTVDPLTHDKIAGVLQAMRAADQFVISGGASSDASHGHDVDSHDAHAEETDEHSHEESHSEDQHEHEAHEADVNPFGEDADDPFGF